MKFFDKIIIIALFFQFYCVQAQQKTASISFESISYNFGQIKESDGPVSHRFTFTNIGAIPLIIQNAQPSCGCTTPDWSRNPVTPGAKGFIDATFDPKGRPGKFNKTITVNYNGTPSSIVVTFYGEVLAKKLGIEDIYPYQFGNLRGKAPQLSYGNIYLGQQKTEKFELINPTQSAITIDCYNIPAHIKILNNPLSLEAGKAGFLEISYDAKVKNDYGFVFDNFMMRFNNAENGINFMLSANLLEDFSKLTENEIQNGPKALFTNTEFKFGTLKSGDKIGHKYILKNVGKSQLLIRKVIPSCGCTTINPPTNSISPGDSIAIPIEFNSAGKSGEQNKTIQVYTNDPTNPRSVLWIKGMIQ